MISSRSLSIRTLRKFVTAVARNVSKPDKDLYITCKSTSLNIPISKIDTTNSKFGTLPLASKGWMHKKAKGDFFIIHPTLDEETFFTKLNSVDSLKNLKIDDVIINNIKNELEIEKLTEIQDNAIPKIMDSNHILIAAQTGCGKTLAYLIPLVQKVLEKKRQIENRRLNTPLLVILTPGRELASQIGHIAAEVVKGLGVQVKTILGGNTKKKMINPEFSELDILVGSIGAISKLVTTGIYRTEQVRHVVLDEADTLLDDSFSEKMSHFLKKFPFHKNHLQDLSDKIIGTQMILASATMPLNINELLGEIVDTDTIEDVVSPNLHRLMPHIQHKFLRMNKSDRPGQLLSVVKTELKKHRPLIIFGNKSSTSDFISIFLNDSGVNCINLNGDMPMKIREGRFEKFQNGEVDVLTTTDVGSRGLDTTRARHVINFDFPLHIADYIHRCGRIGRVGSYYKCLITNFVSSRSEINTVQKIEHAARTGGLLPDVNANITNLIQKKILQELSRENIFK